MTLFFNCCVDVFVLSPSFVLQLLLIKIIFFIVSHSTVLYASHTENNSHIDTSTVKLRLQLNLHD